MIKLTLSEGKGSLLLVFKDVIPRDFESVTE